MLTGPVLKSGGWNLVRSKLNTAMVIALKGRIPIALLICRSTTRSAVGDQPIGILAVFIALRIVVAWDIPAPERVLDGIQFGRTRKPSEPEQDDQQQQDADGGNDDDGGHLTTAAASPCNKPYRP